MVSFQAPLSPTGIRKLIPDFLDNSSKKRKWNENQTNDHQESPKKAPKTDCRTKSFFEIELHLETPLPLEWQRCLDIQSGQIHFYNTKTHKRTSKDPRKSDPEPSPGHMSLELELNLPCESQRKNRLDDSTVKHGSDEFVRSTTSIGAFLENSCDNDQKKGFGGLMMKRIPSWMEGDDDQQQEMMATVCTRCHMLVMLCKKSLSCPNCKFIHPPDQSPPKLFKQSLSLLC